MNSRYDNGWDFTSNTDADLRETFDLFATSSEDPIYRGGMRAIIEETHGRALRVEAARPRSATTRKVCTAGVLRADGVSYDECGGRAVATFAASYGGIVLEEGRCTAHA